jgi:hypothetical protein
MTSARPSAQANRTRCGDALTERLDQAPLLKLTELHSGIVESCPGQRAALGEGPPARNAAEADV